MPEVYVLEWEDETGTETRATVAGEKALMRRLIPLLDKQRVVVIYKVTDSLPVRVPQNPPF